MSHANREILSISNLFISLPNTDLSCRVSLRYSFADDREFTLRFKHSPELLSSHRSTTLGIDTHQCPICFGASCKIHSNGAPQGHPSRRSESRTSKKIRALFSRSAAVGCARGPSQSNVLSPRSGWKHKAWGERGSTSGTPGKRCEKIEPMKWATAFATDCRPLHGLDRYSLSFLGFRSQTRSPQALCFRPLRGLRTFDCDVCPRGRARSGGRACVCLDGGQLLL
jgi:hypothetical protein